MQHLLTILRREEKRNLTGKADLTSDGVRQSLFQGLSLAQYAIAKRQNCLRNHTNCKIDCCAMVRAASILLERRHVSLSNLWREVFTSIPYDSEKAQRRFLQMPVASLKIDGVCVLTEKRQDACYDALIQELSKSSDFGGKRTKEIHITTSDFASLITAVPNSGERERIKHVVASSHNLSVREGAQFGIRNMRNRAEKVLAATNEIHRIKNKHSYFARVEQTAFLQSAGCNPDSYLSSDSSSSDSEDENLPRENESRVHPAESEKHIENLEPDESQASVLPLNTMNETEAGYQASSSAEGMRGNSEMREEDNKAKNCTTLSGINHDKIVNVLRHVHFNWYSLIAMLEPNFQSQGYTQEVFDQVLQDFHNRLPELGLSDAELSLAEQSHAVYTSEIMEKEIRCSLFEDTDEKDSDEEFIETDEEAIRKKLKLIRDKAARRAKAEIVSKGLYGRRHFGGTSSFVSKYPDIGKVMEQIAQEADIGADQWRRTGVYTFTGDFKREKKLTFKIMQEKLQEHYGEKISYGTVLQLCVPRNMRRLSSKRYKGVANIKYKRARKGFNVKYNPDMKWSRSLYKCLDSLQRDGKHILLINRDDQAGFRLDSTFTHKSTPSLSVNGPTITTHTDFMNKHQSQLQTTCYNFSHTSTTSEVCAGVVKASLVHEKSPAQHMADLEMLQNTEHLKALFQSEPAVNKDIECIRVDGASDEGPSHLEVQFLWAERHMKQPTKVTLVTTRCSGDSFLNRVELQNGCLSRGHGNLFIPSTLCGEPYDQDGQFSEAKHKQNMEAAIEQYIARVDGTSCMGTQIKLQSGCRNSVFTERRTRVLTFLKGSAKAKADLKKSNPAEYKYFEMVWAVRNNHVDKSLPSKYIFLLRCCGNDHCPHPICLQNNGRINPAAGLDFGSMKEVFCICRKPEGRQFMICCDICGEWYHCSCIGMKEEDGKKLSSDDASYVCQSCKEQHADDMADDNLIPTWYPAGPSFNIFPYPVIDTERPWGSQCKTCKGDCTGHYVTDMEKYLDLQKNVKALRALPPSSIIEDAFKKGQCDKSSLARKCCLSVEEVTIWLEHLKSREVKRQMGTIKAAETRRKKKEAKECHSMT